MLMSLERLLARCHADTGRIINAGAAARLSCYQKYQTEGERVEFIRQMIRNPAGMKNGWVIDQAGGVSLESIVLDHEPALFDDRDKKIAAQTLDRVNITTMSRS